MTTEKFANCVCEWDADTNRGGIYCHTSDDQTFDSIDDLKAAIIEAMEFGEHSQWHSGNAPELQWLASAAGLCDWVAEQESEA